MSTSGNFIAKLGALSVTITDYLKPRKYWLVPFALGFATCYFFF